MHKSSLGVYPGDLHLFHSSCTLSEGDSISTALFLEMIPDKCWFILICDCSNLVYRQSKGKTDLIILKGNSFVVEILSKLLPFSKVTPCCWSDVK